MNDRFFELPEAARRLIRAIEATIEEAGPLLREGSAPPELLYNFEQTKARYLPETIQAFLGVPPSQRTSADAPERSATDLLLEQLSVLDRAVKRDLRLLGERKRGDLEANARFLAERFDDRSTEIATADDGPAPAASVGTLAQWLPAGGASAAETVAFVWTRLREHFPGITEVRGRGIFGMGGVEAVAVTLAQGGGTAFRYTLSAREGILDASVAKLVHGTSIQTVRCSAQEWLESLYDDIVDQARRHAEMRAPLARLFSNKEIS